MITLIHPQRVTLKEAPEGFSWTMLFFGFFVPLSRNYLSAAFLALTLSFFTGGISWFIYPFFINKQYLQWLLDQGYVPRSFEDETKIRAIGIELVNIARDEADNDVGPRL